MKQIYNFETQEPPRLSTAQLEKQLAARQLRRQMTLLAACAAAIHCFVFLSAWVLLPLYPALAMGLLLYGFLSAAGSSAVVLVYLKGKEREFADGEGSL